MKNRRLLVFGLLALIAILIALALLKAKNRETGTEVTIETVEKRTITELVSASGRIFPKTEVKISSDVSGEIVELYIQEGDSVKQGQLLARVDPEAVQSQVERATANVNSAKAQLANARAQVENSRAQKAQIEANLTNAQEIFKRNKQLRDQGAISQAEFETSQASLRSFEANLQSAEASIRSSIESVRAAEFGVQSAEATARELRTSLNRTSIYAPVTGIVSLLNVEEGERVVGTIQMTGTELMRISDLSKMEVQVEVSENDIPRVSVNDEVDIEVDAYLGRTFKGKVSQVANSAANLAAASAANLLTSDQVTNFVVTIDIDPASYQDLITKDQLFPFRPGMSASVDVRTTTVKDIVAVPIQAVTTREKEQEDKKKKTTIADEDLLEVIFVVSGDTVIQQEVTTGIQDDTYIEITKGMSVGTTIVTGPYSAVARKLEPGDEVREKKDDDDEEAEE